MKEGLYIWTGPKSHLLQEALSSEMIDIPRDLVTPKCMDIELI